MATRTIYLIRHGQHQGIPSDKYKLNDLTLEQRIKLGLKEAGLTSIGIEQAKRTAQKFSSFPINAIHCSSLRRAAETAEIIAREFPGVPLRRSQILWECMPSVPPSLTEQYAQVPTETMDRLKKQAESAFDRYFKCARGNDKHEIIVAHGNILRYFVCRVLQVQPEVWVKMGSCNCGISEILVKPDGSMMLVSYNDVGHLPYYLTTCLGAKKHVPQVAEVEPRTT